MSFLTASETRLHDQLREEIDHATALCDFRRAQMRYALEIEIPMKHPMDSVLQLIEDYADAKAKLAHAKHAYDGCGFGR